MIKYLFIFLLSLNILSSNENIVKTSELELFLFKIGFESLLKDVDINKDKTKLNEEEIKIINEKIELIMSELYKNKRVLFNDSKKYSGLQNYVEKEELEYLKKEIAFLKKEVIKLKEKKENIRNISYNKKNQKIVNMRVSTVFLAVYKQPDTNSNIIRKVKRNTLLQIEFCKNGWCKLVNEKYYVRKFLLTPYP